MKKETILALVTVLIWSTLAPITKVLLRDIPSMEILCLGAVFAFLFLLCSNAIRGKLSELFHTPLRDVARMAGFGFLGLFLYSALYYYGIEQLTSSEACILNYLWPLMIVLFSCLLLKEPLTARKILALLCSFLGIIILSVGDSSGTGHPIAGILSCIIAAACYGLFSVLNKKADMDQDLTMMVIWFTTALCAGIAGLFGPTWVPIPPTTWVGLLWIGIVVNAVAYLLWALAINGSTVTAGIANLAYLVPLLSMVLSVLFLHEPLRLRAVLALILIVGGILMQSFPAKTHEG